MATKLTSENVIERETATEYRHRPIMIELHSGYMILREKGRRGGFMLDYEAAFETAMKMHAREVREK